MVHCDALLGTSCSYLLLPLLPLLQPADRGVMLVARRERHGQDNEELRPDQMTLSEQLRLQPDCCNSTRPINNRFVRKYTLCTE